MAGFAEFTADGVVIMGGDAIEVRIRDLHEACSPFVPPVAVATCW